MSSEPDDRLERQYRRLLVAYPRAYRHERGDEIVGVLLDAAQPDQPRPSLRDVADVVRAGLLARAGAARTSYSSSSWRDAVSVVSVLLPLVLAARAVLWAFDALTFFRNGVDLAGWAQWFAVHVIYGGVPAVLWVAVAVAVVGSRLRMAVVCATAATAAQATLVIKMAIIDSAYWALASVAVLAVEAVATVLLVRRTDVENGVDLVGRRGLMTVLAGLILAKAGGVRWWPTPFGVVGEVGRWVCVVGGLAALGWVIWARRQRLMAGALGLRLGVAGLVLLGIVAVTGIVQHRTSLGHATTKHLIVLFVLCLSLVAAVVIATATTSRVVGRLWKRRPAWIVPR